MKKFRIPTPCPRCQSNATGIFEIEGSIKMETKTRYSYAQRGLHTLFVSPIEARELARMQANAFCNACGFRYHSDMETVTVEKEAVPDFLKSRGISINEIKIKRSRFFAKLIKNAFTKSYT